MSRLETIDPTVGVANQDRRRPLAIPHCIKEAENPLPAPGCQNIRHVNSMAWLSLDHL
jgi:hypothetical protein